MVYGAGSIRVMMDGQVIGGVGYGGASVSATQVASTLASTINQISGSPVTASASGTRVTLTSKLNGAATNYSLSSSYTTSYPTYLQAVPSGPLLTGGTD